MNEKFFDLKQEKQDRMINAALKVFAMNGYQHASTDEIVKEAGISKGLLFHYFISKIGLYEFLYDYSARYMQLELRTSISESETDYFKLIRQEQEAQMEVCRKYPYMQLFIDRSMTEDVPEAIDVVKEQRIQMQETYDAILERVDQSRFPEDLELIRLHNMLQYTLKALLIEQSQMGTFDPDRYCKEAITYLDMVRTMAYRFEEQ